MDGVLRIIQSISDTNKTAFDKYLKAIDEHQSFRLDPTDPAFQHITALLNKPATRGQGLFLLDVFMKQSNLDVISQKGQLWATICIKICNQRSNTNSVNQAYKCLEFLITKSVDIPEVSKAFSSQLLTKLCETFNSIRPESHLAALNCLEKSLRIFPGACGMARSTIEKFLSSFIDDTDADVVYMSGKCFHLVQQVKRSGNAGNNSKSAWQLYQLKIIGSLHELLDSIFVNFPKTYDEDIETEQLSVSPLDLSVEPVQRSAQLIVRFKNLLTYLSIALREPFPTSKQIMPKKILNIISRGLSVNCIMVEKNPISDNLAIGALLPELHIQLFKLLDQLILILKTHLAMYTMIILRFTVDTLKWTCSGKSDGFQKPYRSLRIAAYNTLSLWCNTMKCGSLCELVCETLIEQIKCDITPFHAELTLKVLSGSKKHMSKKARRQLHKAENESSNIAQVHSKAFNPHNTRKLYSDEGNAELCTVALKCLKNIIISSANFMKPTTVKDLQERILTLCVQLPEESTQREKLYWNSACRKAVYDIVYTLLIAPHYLCPPPAQLAVSLLEIGQHMDKSVAVKMSCCEYLRNIERIIHPQKECLYFPPDIAGIKNAFRLRNKKSRAQDKNDSSSEEEDEIVLPSKVNEVSTTNENLGTDSEPSLEAIESAKLLEQEKTSSSNQIDKESTIEYIDDKEIISVESQIVNTKKTTKRILESANEGTKGDIFHANEILTQEIQVVSEDEKNTEQPLSIDLRSTQSISSDVDVVEEPQAKKTRLEGNENNSIEEACNANDEDLENNMLNSILTTFHDELNENPSE